MNYKKHYDLLIEKAIKRENCEGYVERHHIIPRALGGDNSRENLVKLTAREHFIAHLLLAKIYGDKMWNAIWMMSTAKRYNAKQYEWIKREFSKVQSERYKGKPNLNWLGRKHTEESNQKNRNKHLGKKYSQESLNKKSKSLILVHANRSDDYKKEINKKISISNKGNKNKLGWITSEETKRKIGNANKGKYVGIRLSQERIQKAREGYYKKKEEKIKNGILRPKMSWVCNKIENKEKQIKEILKDDFLNNNKNWVTGRLNKCFIYNLELNKVKQICTFRLNDYLNLGWVKSGRNKPNINTIKEYK